MKRFAKASYKEGDLRAQIFPVIEVRLFYPGNEKSLTKRYRAGTNRGFTAEGIEEILNQIADAAEKRFPGHEYEMVELAPNRFNVVHRKAPDGIIVTRPLVETVTASPISES